MRVKMSASNPLHPLGVAAVALVMVLGAAVPRVVKAQSKPASMRMTQEQVLDLQKKFADASVAGDTAALDPLLADDMVFVHGGAAMQTKAEYLASLKSGQLKIATYQAGDPKVVFFRGGAIISAITEVGLASPNGGPPRVLRMRISNVWIAKPAGWQMILTQGTPVQSAPTNQPH